MAYRKDSKNLQTEIKEEVKTAFKKQLKERGQIQNDAATAALRIWLSLPHGVQSLIISGPPEDVYQFLLDQFLMNDLVKEIERLGPLKRRFLALLKQTGVQSSRRGSSS